MIADLAISNRRPYVPAVLFLVVLAHGWLVARLDTVALSSALARSHLVSVANAAAPLIMLSIAPAPPSGSVTATLVNRATGAVRTKSPAAMPAAMPAETGLPPNGESKVADRRTGSGVHELPALPVSDENLDALDGTRARAGTSSQPVEYRLARGSHVFGGNFPAAEPDRRGSTVPSVSPGSSKASVAAPVAAYVREGVARGAYAIGAELAGAGDGRCEVQMNTTNETAPRMTCSTSELTAAGEQLSAASVASLATWLRAGLVRSIDINLSAGHVEIDIR